MASVSGVSSSTSIYGNRNVISGLASGLDTETLIENAISAYKNKITALQQKRTTTEWKQESYRSIIEKMSSFMDKYTSYRSSNNLMSASFFDQAVKTVAKGANASLVSATGKASSNIQIDRVKQLATAATYKLSGSALDAGTSSFGSGSIAAAAPDAMDLDGITSISTFSGSMTLAYGGSSALSYLSINFDETKTYDSPQELADEINRQLAEQSVSIGSTSYTGQNLLNNVIKAEVDGNGNISFTDPKHNNVYISTASESIRNKLLGGVSELSSVAGEQVKTLNASNVQDMQESKANIDYLADKTMSITLDGVTKTIKMPGADDVKGLTGADRDAAYVKALQDNIDKAFGAGKVTVSDKNGTNADRTSNGIQLQFEAKQNGSTLSVSSSAGKTMGFGESERVTSYLNTGKTLGELLGTKDFSGFDKAYTAVTDSNGNTKMVEAKDSDGNQLYSFKVNGEEVGQFNENSKLSDVMAVMNGSSKSGVSVAYSKLTNELNFTAKETGANSKVEFSGLSAALFGAPDTYDAKGTYTKGQDAIFEATVNGTSLGEITRSSNSVEMDGMTINLKGTFGYEKNEDGSIKYNVEQERDENGNPLFYMYQGGGKEKQVSAKELSDGRLEFTDERTGKTVYGELDADGNLSFTHQNGATVYARLTDDGRLTFTEDASLKQNMNAVMTQTAVKDNKAEAVTFETSSDADKIVDVIKQMVSDYNAMVAEIKNAYSTLPVQRSNGAYYQPLTDEDMEGMSESSIKAWEDKAKQGILFGDRDLANLYQRLTSAVSMTGEFGATLRSAGITVNYANGLSTLEFNEDDFRAALEKDPDAVRDAFTASTESGASQNGLMQALKVPLDMYGKTAGGKGILVEKAGSPLAASTMYTNTIQKELNSIDEQIEKWQDKMSAQIDYYTSQFSRLEQLIAQMNSQSSYFAQLTGGGY